MAIVPALIWNLLVPGTLSALIILLARRLGRTGPSGHRGRWGVAVGLGLGYLSGSYGLQGWPRLPTTDALTDVSWLVLAAIILGVIESSWFVPGWPTWLARGLLASVVVVVSLSGRDGNHWTSAATISLLTAIWVVLMASWWNLEQQAARLSGPGWVVPLILIASGWSLVRALEGEIAPARMDAVLASTLFGALTTLGLRPGLALSKGGPAIVITVLASLALTGIVDSKTPLAVTGLFSLALWAPWVDRIALVRRRSYWTRASVRFFAVLLMVGLALYLTDAWSDPDIDDQPRP